MSPHPRLTEVYGSLLSKSVAKCFGTLNPGHWIKHTCEDHVTGVQVRGCACSYADIIP